MWLLLRLLCDKIWYGFSATPIYGKSPIIKRKGLSMGNTFILHLYYQRGYYRGSDKEELIGFTEFLFSMWFYIYNRFNKSFSLKIFCIQVHCCFLQLTWAVYLVYSWASRYFQSLKFSISYQFDHIVTI